VADDVQRFFMDYELGQEKRTEFDVANGEFGDLEIRNGDGGGGFHYFFETDGNRLIKSFLLKGGPRVDTVCDVVLIKVDEGGYSPRLTLWKRDKTKGARAVAQDEAPRPAKAMVRLGDCHETFWRLIDFLRSFKDINLPPDAFRVADAGQVQLLDALQDHDKDEVLAAVSSYLEGHVTEREVRMLVNRKTALEYFQRMLTEPGFAESERDQLQIGPEALWQQFFEDNPWIFGYGLHLVSCEAFSADKLEQVTTGWSVFGAGKRADAIMRTRGLIRSLMFVEIKRPDTPLLLRDPYRPPDVFCPTKELVGSVAQVQKTTHKAIQQLHDELYRQYSDSGSFDFEVSTVKPRQAVVIGDLAQLTEDGNINREKMSSFELFRRDHQDVEILTFDELWQRARFIVVSDESPL
jgi:Domain of unknown function (DUF4263)